MHLLLIGASGSGKSTLAPMLAEHLDMPFCDTDKDFITHYGVSGGEIIRTLGIAAFRAKETPVVLNALMFEGMSKVIATGAGAWTVPEVRSAAGKTALTVWVHANPQILKERIAISDRQIVRAKPAKEVISEQICQRAKYYALADYIFDSNFFKPTELAELIATSYSQHLDARGMQRESVTSPLPRGGV